VPYLKRPPGRPPKEGYETVIELGKYQAESWEFAQRVILVVVDRPDPKAGVNMDGLQLGGMLDKDVKRPFLFMHHDNIEAANKTPNLLFFERAKAPVYSRFLNEVCSRYPEVELRTRNPDGEK